MQNKKTRIGLALSGGGMRATVFHLGVLKHLAQADCFDQIASLSSVSGASLCVGAIFAANQNRWPTGQEFLNRVLPKVRATILGADIQKAAVVRLPFSPCRWLDRTRMIARMLEKKWGISGNLQDLPVYPYWEINCTTFETGKRFRIRRDFMGDYTIGYTQKPTLPTSEMMAASAGFPILIGPYILKTDEMRWTKDKWGKGEEAPVAPRYALWDGGVYDNLGLEALYKIGRGLDSEIDFLIISNASPGIAYQTRSRNFSLGNVHRLLDIAMFQVDALRSRSVFSSIISRGQGVYIQIGAGAGHPVEGHLSPEEAALVRDHPTTLRTPTPTQFDRILRHGCEMAYRSCKTGMVEN